MRHHHVITRRDLRRERARASDKGGAGLAAGRCKTPWVRGPGIQCNARHIVPRAAFPFSKIQFEQTPIHPRRTDCVGNHAAALRRTGPDEPGETPKLSGDRLNVRMIGKREIGAAITDAGRDIGAGMADEGDHDAT